MSKELVALTAVVENLAAGERGLAFLVDTVDRITHITYYRTWRQASDAWHTAEGLLTALEEADAAEQARIDAEDALDTRGKEEGRCQ